MNSQLLEETKPLFVGGTGILFSGIIIGILFGNPPPRKPISESPGVVYFFCRNIRVAAVMWFGAVSFGLLTIVTLLINGAAIGFAANVNNGLVRTLALLGPHGIVELPGFVVAAAAGFKLPWEVMQYIRGNRPYLLTHHDFRITAKLIVLSSLLIGIAAILEAFVTAQIVAGVWV